MSDPSKELKLKPATEQDKDKDIDTACEFLIATGPHILAILANRMKVQDTGFDEDSDLLDIMPTCKKIFAFVDQKFAQNTALKNAIKGLSYNAHEIGNSVKLSNPTLTDKKTIALRVEKFLSSYRLKLKTILKDNSELVGKILKGLAQAQLNAEAAESFLLANNDLFAEYYLNNKKFKIRLDTLSRESLVLMNAALDRNAHDELVEVKGVEKEFVIKDIARFKWALQAIDEGNVKKLKDILYRNPFLDEASLTCEKNLTATISLFNKQHKPVILHPIALSASETFNFQNGLADFFSRKSPAAVGRIADLDTIATAGTSDSPPLREHHESPKDKKDKEDEPADIDSTRTKETNHV